MIYLSFGRKPFAGNILLAVDSVKFCDEKEGRRHLKQYRFMYLLKRKQLLRKLVEININIAIRFFVDVQSNRK